MEFPELTATKSDFSDRRILITGATGSIGHAAALLLANAGAKLVLNGRDQSRLEAVAADLPANSCTLAPFDLADTGEIVAWIRGLCEKDGPFSGVAHCAGLQILRPISTITSSFVKKIFDVNMASGIMLGKALQYRNCHTAGMPLVLISSTAAFIGGCGNVAYAASKGAVMATSKALAFELHSAGIRVNCIIPGLVESDMSQKAKEATPEESWQQTLSAYPLGQGQAEDIAQGIVYLLSDAAKWATGTELQIDGGLSIV